MGLPDHLIAELDCGDRVELPIVIPDSNTANNVLAVTVDFRPLYEHRETVHREPPHE